MTKIFDLEPVPMLAKRGVLIFALALLALQQLLQTVPLLNRRRVCGIQQVLKQVRRYKCLAGMLPCTSCTLAGILTGMLIDSLTGAGSTGDIGGADGLAILVRQAQAQQGNQYVAIVQRAQLILKVRQLLDERRAFGG